jgi:hypothetical protein
VLRGSGSLSAERKQYLEDLGNQLGLGAEERDKIIREVRVMCVDNDNAYSKTVCVCMLCVCCVYAVCMLCVCCVYAVCMLCVLCVSCVCLVDTVWEFHCCR